MKRKMIEQNREIEKENWYAIVTRPKAEKKVYTRLLDSGFDVFLPLITTVKQWSDRKKKVESPLITSFVFVKIEEKYLSKVLGEIGVLRVLKYLKRPAIISKEEINVLKVLINDAGNVTVLNRVDFCKGQKVEITKGPFEGLEAECVQFQGKHRVVIRAMALGVVMQINVPLSFIEKINLKVAI